MAKNLNRRDFLKSAMVSAAGLASANMLPSMVHAEKAVYTPGTYSAAAKDMATITVQHALTYRNIHIIGSICHRHISRKLIHILRILLDQLFKQQQSSDHIRTDWQQIPVLLQMPVILSAHRKKHPSDSSDLPDVPTLLLLPATAIPDRQAFPLPASVLCHLSFRFPGLPSSFFTAVGFGFLPAIGIPSFPDFPIQKGPCIST